MQSDPAPDARLDVLPASVTLLFTEPVTAAGPGIRVYSPSGRQVAAPVNLHDAVMSAPLTSDERGTFVVTWQVLAADTHPSRGVFAFSVGPPSANPYASLLTSGAIGTASPAGLVLQALAHWIHFAGFALVFGIAGYRTLTRAAGMSRSMTAGVVLLMLAEPLGVIAQLASLSFDGDTAVGVLGSDFGRVTALRLAAALVAWTLMATGRQWPQLIVGAVVATLDGLTAHAVPGVVGIGQALVSVHVAAMGLWVGGIVGFVQAPDRRFARYAAATFGTAIASGAVLAFVHTAAWSSLVDTDYGRVLIAKVAVVALAVVTVMLRRRRLELVAAAGIIGAATLLGALPPSR